MINYSKLKDKWYQDKEIQEHKLDVKFIESYNREDLKDEDKIGNGHDIDDIVSSNQSKKIALVYWGLLRSFDKVYQSHINNIYNVFLKNNIEFKIFSHTWKTNGDKQKVWQQTIDKKQNYEQIKLVDYHKFKIDEQDVFEKNLKFDDYFYKDKWFPGRQRNGEWDPDLLKNHLCALESQKRSFEMVENDNIDFDYVMFLRPDVLFKNKFPIDTIDYLHQNENGILVPNFDSYEGVNDRFAVTNYNYAKYYAKRLDGMVEYRKKHGRIIAEKYTGDIVKKYYKKKDIDFKFNIVRP